MNYILKYLKVIIFPLTIILLFPFILSILNKLGIQSFNLFILIIMIITFFISGYTLGKKVNKKSYLNGLIFGLITVLFMFLISLFFKEKYHLSTLIYYLILALSSMFGSMISATKK